MSEHTGGPPGNLVFGRRRFMRALAPPDGTLGVPGVITIPGRPEVDLSGTCLGLIPSITVTVATDPTPSAEPSQSVSVVTGVV
ncbi:hypothetical protein LCGC14_0364160 [marine sediment metagenome]|uniref:Uncharacterized protein n=1 Tax=marine sediment metagenome TaxID=412755 RepID=A0A0F9TQ50_9ZZZZ